MRSGLQTRAISLCVALLTGAAILIGTVLIPQAHQQAFEAFTNHAKVYSRAIGRAIEPAVLLGDHSEMERILWMARQDHDVQAAVVRQVGGGIVAAAPSGVSEDAVPLTNQRLTALALRDTVELVVNDAAICVHVPLWQYRGDLEAGLELDEPAPGAREGMVAVLSVQFARQRLHDEVGARIRSMIVILLGVLGAAVTVTIIAMRQLLRPLRTLRDAVRRVSSGDRTTRAHADAPGEIGELAQAFNEMADKVQRSYEVIERRVEERTLQLVQANRAKDDFLANMSHEIRTPMTAILGFAEQLLDPELSDTERREAVHVMRRNGEHLLQIVNNILDLSKIEAGKLSVERITVSPREIVCDAVALVADRAREKSLPIRVDFDPALPEHICTDPTRLRQILVNLIGNAVKFTETGEVRVRAGWETPATADNATADDDAPAATAAGADAPALTPRARLLCFEVADTGIGLQPEQDQRLFKPFTQGDESMTRRFGGTGLGLAISRSLARALGGDIRVSSAPGTGSTFSATLDPRLAEVARVRPPQHTPIVATPAGASSSAGELQGLRLLLAEDGPDNQRLIAAFLRKDGAEVALVDNGRAAVQRARDAREAGQPFDAILMDMQMPIMDGYTATGELRRLQYDGAIIALTAHAMSADRQRCLDAGCDAYATKPIDRKRLVQMIREELARRQVHDGGAYANSASIGSPEPSRVT
ncbi:MAG: Sensor histidine kinase RcsC [Phycisphaerae bacterium]|nr:Sensor histidine kinase RcsC [Phycisphaerae bacterium]